MRRFPRMLTAGAALVLLTATGCADNADNGGADQSTKPSVCDSLAAVQTTAGHIRDANVSENGLSQLRPYLQQLRDELAQLVADAKTQWKPQADALRTSVDDLTGKLETAKADPSTTNLSAV